MRFDPPETRRMHIGLVGASRSSQLMIGGMVGSGGCALGWFVFSC